MNQWYDMYKGKSINTLFTMGFNSWSHRIICLFTLSYNLAAELQYYNVFQLQQKLYKIVLSWSSKKKEKKDCLFISYLHLICFFNEKWYIYNNFITFYNKY